MVQCTIINKTTTWLTLQHKKILALPPPPGVDPDSLPPPVTENFPWSPLELPPGEAFTFPEDMQLKYTKLVISRIVDKTGTLKDKIVRISRESGDPINPLGNDVGVPDIVHRVDQVPHQIEQLLNAFTDEEPLIVYPVPYPPFLRVSVYSHMRMALVHSWALGCEEAEVVCAGEKDFKMYKEAVVECRRYATGGAVPDVFSSLKMPTPEELSRYQKQATATPVRVREGPESGLCEDEKTARSNRWAHVRSGMRLSDENSRVPCVALVTSGGGMRAMLASVGYYQALKEIGVLDVAMYTTSLSSSTWTTAKWMCDLGGNPFVHYKEGADHIDCWSSEIPPMPFKSVDFKKLAKMASSKIKKEEAIKILWNSVNKMSLIAGYSELLSHKLGTRGIPTNYSAMADKAKSGFFPIPVFTACYPDKDNYYGYFWQDFTPFEVGSTHARTFFDLKHLQMDGSALVPPTLADLMAMWGSSFDGAPFSAVVEEMIESVLPKALKWVLAGCGLPGSGCLNPNFARKDKTSQHFPLADQEYLYLRDAGISANIPAPALLTREERTVDLMIVLDATWDIGSDPFGELKRAIPSLELPKRGTFEYSQPVSFAKTDKHPAIVYIPIKRHAKYVKGFDPDKKCGTTKFDYDKKTATDLVKLAYHWTMSARDQIWKCIWDAVDPTDVEKKLKKEKTPEKL